jgi:hypothetical protein
LNPAIELLGTKADGENADAVASAAMQRTATFIIFWERNLRSEPRNTGPKLFIFTAICTNHVDHRMKC